MSGKAHPKCLCLLLLAVLIPSTLPAQCPKPLALWNEINDTYPELGLRDLMVGWAGSPFSPAHLTCVENGDELDAALEEPNCGSIIVLDDGTYETPGSRSFFNPWQLNSSGNREPWTAGSCSDDEPLIVLARNPVIEAPDPTKRGPGDMSTTSLYTSGESTFSGAVLLAPLTLHVESGTSNHYSNIWVAGLQFYGDPAAGLDGDGGFWMSSNRVTGCSNCLIYRNLFRRIYGSRGAIRLYRARDSAILGNRFVEVGLPGVEGGTKNAYPLALFDSRDLKIGWNLFDGIPLEASNKVTGETDTWAGLTDGALDWRLAGLVSGKKHRNVLYGTFSATSNEKQRTGVCGLRFFRNVLAHSGAMDIKNALCDPQGAPWPLNEIRIFDNSFINTGGITFHAGDTWTHVDGNDFIGTNGVRITNSKADAEGDTRRPDYYGYLHDHYITENLMACGSKGVLVRGGKRYYDKATKHDPARDLYNIVVAANWILFNDDQPFDIDTEGLHSGMWIRGILGNRILEVGRFGDPLNVLDRRRVDYGLYVCGNVIGANGDLEESDPEHFDSCPAFDLDQRFQIHPTKDEDMVDGAWGWDASAGHGALYDANTVVTSVGEDRLTPIRPVGATRQTEFLTRVGPKAPTYEDAWKAFCHVGASALYDGPWGSDYGRVGRRATAPDRLIGPKGSLRLWQGGATLEHSSTVGACPTRSTSGSTHALDESRLKVRLNNCPTELSTKVAPDWAFIDQDLDAWADDFWDERFH